MLPFFRKIRKQHADDNQILKYARYAIGEIVLVVIGILIALQINNWKEERKNKFLEKKTLENLKADLEVQMGIIQFQESNERSYTAMADSCLQMIRNGINATRLIPLLDSLSERVTFVANSVTFENLGLDGTTTVLRNSDLQNKIVQYYQQLDYTTSVINNNNLFRTNSQFGSFVVNNAMGFQLNGDGRVDENYSPGAERLYLLKKQLDARRYSSENNLEKCVLQMDNTKELIRLIDKELNE